MMKTLQELYNEVIQSDELKKEFLEAGKNGKAEEFIKAHGCDATLDEIKAFLEAQAKANKKLSVDELENVAGGGCNDATKEETLWSVFTAGTVCATRALSSALGEIFGDGHVGQQTDDEGRLCTNDW